MNFPQTAFGEVLTARLSPKAGWRADYSVNTRLYTTAESVGGTVVVDDNRFKLSTTATANRKAILRTKKKLRYLPGMGGLLRDTVIFDTAAPVGSFQALMIGDANNGFGFGFDGQTFGTLRRRDAVNYWTPETQWNGSAVTWDKAKGDPYQLRYQWLGYGFVRFYVLNPNWRAGAYDLVNTLSYPNTSAAVHIKNPTLPVSAEAWNGDNAYNVVLYTPSAMAFLEGEDELPLHPLDLYSPIDASGVFANTSVNHALTIRNKSLYTVALGTPNTTVDNQIPCELRSMVLSRGSAGATRSKIQMYRNAVTAGALTYTDYETLNSPLDYSITTTTINTGSSPAAERTYYLSDGAAQLPLNFLPGQIELLPGESMTWAWENGGTQSTEWAITAEMREKY